MPSQSQLRALNRFGLGARPNQADQIDPKNWLRAQVSRNAAMLPNQGLPTTQAVLEQMASYQRGQASDAEKRAFRQASMAKLRREAVAAMNHGLTTQFPFAERLARFWSNHFAVSVIGEQQVRSLAGVYEREAIRPHVFGKFEDMALASAMHPAMLVYLDQARSVGPNSKVGTRRERGLNENYARELMELHTLGVNGGYGQADVENLALMLTGWTIGGVSYARRQPIQPFTFLPAIHEPGSKTLLGRPFAEAGEQEGRAAIRLLVQHPSTARFIATKLVRHFVGDIPSSRDADSVANVFRSSGGDLAQVALALIELESAYLGNTRKFRPPQELVIAMGRALGVRQIQGEWLNALTPLRHQYWSPLSPAGYGDIVREWADPDSLVKRTELAQAVADLNESRPVDAAALAGQVVQSNDLTGLQAAIQSQDNAVDGLALLLASPDFQWR